MFCEIADAIKWFTLSKRTNGGLMQCKQNTVTSLIYWEDQMFLADICPVPVLEIKIYSSDYRKTAMEKKYLVNYWCFYFAEALYAVAMVPIQMVAFGKCQQCFYRHATEMFQFSCINFFR